MTYGEHYDKDYGDDLEGPQEPVIDVDAFLGGSTPTRVFWQPPTVPAIIKFLKQRAKDPSQSYRRIQAVTGLSHTHMRGYQETFANDVWDARREFQSAYLNRLYDRYALTDGSHLLTIDELEKLATTVPPDNEAVPANDEVSEHAIDIMRSDESFTSVKSQIAKSEPGKKRLSSGLFPDELNTHRQVLEFVLSISPQTLNSRQISAVLDVFDSNTNVYVRDPWALRPLLCSFLTAPVGSQLFEMYMGCKRSRLGDYIGFFSPVTTPRPMDVTGYWIAAMERMLMFKITVDMAGR